eukprot:361241-Chlamydomonas_euryale.AAC.4
MRRRRRALVAPTRAPYVLPSTQGALEQLDSDAEADAAGMEAGASTPGSHRQPLTPGGALSARRASWRSQSGLHDAAIAVRSACGPRRMLLEMAQSVLG